VSRRLPPFRVNVRGDGIMDAVGEPVLWDGQVGGFSTDTREETDELMQLFAAAPELHDALLSLVVNLTANHDTAAALEHAQRLLHQLHGQVVVPLCLPVAALSVKTG
jgi:hypothetical protein